MLLTISKLGTRSWKDIFSTQRKGLGTETITFSSLPNAKPAATKERTYYSIRFGKRGRLVGFRDEQIFHICWIDRDFTANKH